MDVDLATLVDEVCLSRLLAARRTERAGTSKTRSSVVVGRNRAILAAFAPSVQGLEDPTEHLQKSPTSQSRKVHPRAQTVIGWRGRMAAGTTDWLSGVSGADIGTFTASVSACLFCGYKNGRKDCVRARHTHCPLVNNKALGGTYYYSTREKAPATMAIHRSDVPGPLLTAACLQLEHPHGVFSYSDELWCTYI